MISTRWYSNGVVGILAFSCARPSNIDKQAIEQPSAAEVAVTASGTSSISETSAQAEESDLQRMERVFRAESVDDAWAHGREAELREALKSRDDLTVQRVDCRTTICRMQLIVVRDAGLSGQGFLHQSQMLPRHAQVFNGATTIYSQPSDSAGILYVTRPGYGFPNHDGSPNRRPETK